MDPVSFFSVDVSEIIFNLLPHKDLLNCTLVSQSWNKLIGSSARLMGKFYLGLRGDWHDFNEENKKIITRGRKYSNVIISDAMENISFVYDVMSSYSNWKTVKIYIFGFETSSDFVKFFKTFESTVETLLLYNVKIFHFNISEINFSFRRLNNFSVSYCTADTLKSVLENSQSLRTLDIGNLNEDGREEIVTILAKCRKLKSLHTSEKWFNVLFKNETSRFSFQLEVLSVINCLENANSQREIEIEQNFLKFLEDQSKSLLQLNLIGAFRSEVLETVFQMPKLEKLTIPQIRLHDTSKLDFFKSKSLTSLDIVCSSFAIRKIFLSIIRSVPNLKRLRMRSINQETAMILMENLKNLEKIYLVHHQPKIVEKILAKVCWEE